MADITGSGSGIGRAGAELFARKGASVVVAELRPKRGRAVASAITEAGGAAGAIVVDVRARDSVAAMVETVIGRYGRLDLLFHDAMDVPLVNERSPGDHRDPSSSASREPATG